MFKFKLYILSSIISSSLYFLKKRGVFSDFEARSRHSNPVLKKFYLSSENCSSINFLIFHFSFLFQQSFQSLPHLNIIHSLLLLLSHALSTEIDFNRSFWERERERKDKYSRKRNQSVRRSERFDCIQMDRYQTKAMTMIDRGRRNLFR